MLYFNPRSHCRERQSYIHIALGQEPFQSTFPLQGTTDYRVFFYGDEGISIHVPIAGNDDKTPWRPSIHMPFQSTFPLQGTTERVLDKYGRVDISIHVPIAGNDLRGASVFHRGILFQSTFPLQGTTSIFLFNLFRCIISIHVPIAGNDCEAGYIKQGKVISIHVPIAGNDGERHRKRVERKISIHVPIAGNDACGNEVIDYLHIFQSTFPLQGTTMLICSSIHSSQYFNPRSHCRERRNFLCRST